MEGSEIRWGRFYCLDTDSCKLKGRLADQITWEARQRCNYKQSFHSMRVPWNRHPMKVLRDDQQKHARSPSPVQDLYVDAGTPSKRRKAGTSLTRDGHRDMMLKKNFNMDIGGHLYSPWRKQKW